MKKKLKNGNLCTPVWSIFCFLSDFQCVHFLTLPSVLLSFWDIILCLEKCSKCQGILLKIMCFFTFYCSLQKPQEWAKGIKKWTKSPGTCALVFGIPKNPILDTKIIKIQFGENKIHFSKNDPFLSLLWANFKNLWIGWTKKVAIPLFLYFFYVLRIWPFQKRPYENFHFFIFCQEPKIGYTV